MDTLRTLLFDFLNLLTGRLAPGHAAIADNVFMSPRTVATALAHLRDLGILAWLRRCATDKDEQGRLRLRQLTNAYAIALPAQWKGYVEREGLPADPLPPEPGTRGDHPPLETQPEVTPAESAARSGP